MTTPEQRRQLGDFVRARREATVSPEQTRRRRTPGLRREELAAEAGIGVTWIAWIEQGRDVRPSANTLSRLAAGLHLSRAERAYLFDLAGRHDPENPWTDAGSSAPPSIAALVEALVWPAYGLDPAWDICCWNDAARDLFVGLDRQTDHRNLLRYVFTMREARDLIPDWEVRAARLLAEFRADYGRVMSDPRVNAVVDWLGVHSPFFRETWQRQAVSEREGGCRRFLHPKNGELIFEQHTMRPAERQDFKLVFLQPDTKRAGRSVEDFERTVNRGRFNPLEELPDYS